MHKTRTSPINVPAKKRFELSSYMVSLDTATSADADKTLGSVLTLVNSSHAPLFIFNDESEFIGLVSPHQALYTKRHVYTTKLASIAAMPPNITKETQLYDVASYMLETRVYVLPVFDEKRQIVGVVHAEDILKNLIKDESFLLHISSNIQTHTPITAKMNDTVGDVFQIMKSEQVSRVVLIDDDGALSGIVSRKDVQNAFMKPTEKQRFGKNGNQQTDRAYDEEKEYRADDPVRTYAIKHVYTLPSETEYAEVIKQLVASEHNSVVLVDTHRKPVGFLSVHDILRSLSSLRPEESINLIMRKPSSNVSEDEIQEAEEILTVFGEKMNKRVGINKIEVTFKEPKTPAGGTIEFNTMLMVTPRAGAKLISKTQSRSFLESIRSAMAQIENQQR